MKLKEIHLSSEFKDALLQLMEAPLNQGCQQKILKANWIDTPLGPIIAIGDEYSLYLLEFFNRKDLERKIKHLKEKEKAIIVTGESKATCSIAQELGLYFKGKLKEFKTKLILQGSSFQKLVWGQLLKIPLGETRSYADIAKALKKPTAFRAVAQANGANQFVIMIPCHRVINSNGELGGYAAGIPRKKWLLAHEKI